MKKNQKIFDVNLPAGINPKNLSISVEAEAFR